MKTRYFAACIVLVAMGPRSVLPALGPGAMLAELAIFGPLPSLFVVHYKALEGEGALGAP